MYRFTLWENAALRTASRYRNYRFGKDLTSSTPKRIRTSNLRFRSQETDSPNSCDNTDFGKCSEKPGVSWECQQVGEVRPMSPHGTIFHSLPTELAQVAVHWERIPEHLQTAILALCDSVIKCQNYPIGSDRNGTV
jgi:hypothetical protein